MALYPPWFFDNSSLDTGLIINPADDQNAPIGIVAYYTSPGLLLLFYIKIETLPLAAIRDMLFLPQRSIMEIFPSVQLLFGLKR